MMIKKLLVPMLFSLATTANAAVTVVDTDTSWLTTGTAPASTWNTDLAFDTSGWTPAVVSTANCMGSADCIWFDAVNSATQFSWFRRTFNLSGPILSATLEMGVDDDADVYLNGTQIVNDHDGVSTNLAPFDISSLLVVGDNFIAVLAEDNIPVFGQNHAFVAQLQIQTQGVPEPASLALVALGLASLGAGRWRKSKGK